MKTIAAVPAYNPGDQLLLLAKQLSSQRFDEIYIIDDNSTDDSITKIHEAFPDFKIIHGERRVGPGANRNRIMQHVSDGVIVFIDADMVLTDGIDMSKLGNLLDDEGIGIAGGLILDGSAHPMGWNYGFEMHPSKDAWFWQMLTKITRDDISPQLRDELASELHNANADFNWIKPDLFKLKQRDVDWVAEGLFAIRASTLHKVGGYDETFTYHEGQDLARKVRDLGQRVVFTPIIAATHKAIDVSGEKRVTNAYESQFLFFQKYWGMSRRVYEKLYPVN